MGKWLFFIVFIPWCALANTVLPSLIPWPVYEASHSPGAVSRTQPSSCDIVHLPYVDKDVIQVFAQSKQTTYLSAQGSMQWLPIRRDLMVCDDDQHRNRLKSILLKFNQMPVQIKIHAQILSIDKNDLHDLGINFQTSSQSEKDSSTTDSSSDDLGKNGLQIVLGSLYAQQLLSVQLHALIQNGHAQVISDPSILTSDGVAANIESGEEVPYQEGARSGGTSVAFKKAVMQLAVTPQLTMNQIVNLKIQVHQDKVTPTMVNGVPIISTEQLSTSAMIKNGNTLLLGGIIEKQTSDEEEGVPFLRHLPILGFAFRHHRHEIKDKELIIMISPSW
jgi:type II secretory pathway component GspD/PulD (secretin)